MSMNHIVVIGRATKNAELRTTQNGTPVATFSVAVDRSFNKNGEKETDFIPVVVWRGLAETCGKYLTKGKLIAVEGRLQIRTYEASDGYKKTVAEIVASDVQFLSKNENGGYIADEQPEMKPLDEMPF